MRTDRNFVKTKKLKVLGCVALCLMLLVFNVSRSMAQSNEVQQLLLNVEKLSQLKNILSDMKRGYVLLTNGYNTVKNIAQGNSSLHEVFLDGLMAVSPEVRKYHKVAGIIEYQADILSEYKSAYKRFSGSGVFTVDDLEYLSGVYGKLGEESLRNLDRLLMVLTSGKLRMSDDERLQAIDHIYEDTLDKLGFLRSFNQKTGILALQRQKEQRDIRTVSGYFNNP